MIGALALDERCSRAGRVLAYLCFAIPIALGAMVTVLVLVAGAALAVTGLGLPLLLLASSLARHLVRAQRRTANRFLDTQIPPLPGLAKTSGGPWRRSLEILSDRGLWRLVATLAVSPLLTFGVLVMVAVPIVVLALLVRLAAEGLAGLGNLDYLGPWTLGPALGLVLLALALPAAVLALATLDALHGVLHVIARGLLIPRAAASGPVRELLAESLGDRTVAIAYWLPDRGVFVDETGRPVTLPEPDSGRTWTAVEREGRPVAAIVHDAALDTTSELVQAAAAASSLAIDNERLKADLRARVEELRLSRLRIVEATDKARRRLERDLHDGAQQQLVALALELRVLRSRLHDEQSRELVDGVAARLDTAITELRELARGIHPSILTERGLGPALEALAQRTVTPVQSDVELDGRLPAAVEAAAYFVVAEALTNVDRYAQASSARLTVRHERDALVVEVTDDGGGGADPEAGSGLRGLADRVAAVDGTLEVDSREGDGTRLTARIPVGAQA